MPQGLFQLLHFMRGIKRRKMQKNKETKRDKKTEKNAEKQRGKKETKKRRM